MTVFFRGIKQDEAIQDKERATSETMDNPTAQRLSRLDRGERQIIMTLTETTQAGKAE